MVTFRQVDPLYAVDLTDPAAPRLLGELKIPGYSEYLHPLGGRRLIGIGQDASADGMVRGAQAALFDVTDLTVARAARHRRLPPVLRRPRPAPTPASSPGCPTGGSP